MAARPKKPSQGTSAVTAAVFVVAGWLAAPVLAAPERDLICDESSPDLSVSVSELTATPVNNSDELLKDHLLKPRADSAARTAFADEGDDAAAETAEEEIEESADALSAEPAIPSALDGERSPFKRAMYRRDI